MGIGKFQPPQNQYPWTDRQKIRQNWLRPWGTSDTKFGRNPSTRGFWANGWNITEILFIYLFILFYLIRLQVRPLDWFLRAIAQKTWNHARMYLFGVMKL